MNNSSNITEIILDLINNFDNYLNDMSSLTSIVNKISNLDAYNRKLKPIYTCRFRETNRIGQCGYVDEETKEILFNLTRTRIVSQRRIESNTESGLINFLGFKDIFHSLVQPTDDDIILYQFLTNPNWEGYFNFFANYKLLPIEIVHTIFHENEHLVQNDFSDNVVSKHNYARMKENIYMTFVCVYQKMFLELQNANKLGDYKRDNVYFPIEIDAEYMAEKTFDNLELDKDTKTQINNYRKFINRFDKIKYDEDFSNKIWSDFEYLYKLYNENFSEDKNLKVIVNIIFEKKDIILENYKKIYLFWKRY